ncbi:carbohydrate ABC transporter permease [Enterocloster lavalensis]|uniref:carbohydrate ABC transporter permease n=1 Tax=Enterocloster lavalensis TaxID=460384 RepID=UPI0026655C26|nr:carbohydrate ABC transporter permease [Enterocloster lavalensis]
MLAVKRNPWIFRRSRLQEVRRDNTGARAINAFAVRAVKGAFHILLFLIFFFPFFWMVSTSFKTLGETMTFPPAFLPETFQFSNYRDALRAIPFATYLTNSCIVTGSVTALQLLTVVPAAYGFSQYQFRGKGMLFGLTLVTMMIPAQLVFMPLFILFSKLRMINTYWSLILPFGTSAFGIFMLRQTFNQMPKELVEAAKLDRAGELKRIFRLFLPMARPTLVTMALLTFINTWNDYFWPLALTTSDAVRTLPVGVASLRNIESGTHYNILMASNVMLTIPIIIAYFLAHKQIIKAFTYLGDK